MSFLSVGIDHRRAPLEVLERVSLRESQDAKLLATLSACANVHEAVVLSTCLRTEVVAVIDRFHGAVDDITAALSEVTGVTAEELTTYATINFDRGVVSHLFEVAAGLHSTVPGEHEILGQIKQSVAVAEEQNAIGGELGELFQRAISAGRRARTETGIARGSVSFAHAALDMALGARGADWSGSRVVVVGAGQLALGIVRGLLESSVPPETITIVNRTLAHAEEVVHQLSDERLRARSMGGLLATLDEADTLFVAAEEVDLGSHASYFVERRDPLLVLDLAMPRAISPHADVNGAITRRDIQDLGSLVDGALESRRDELEKAAAVVALEVEHYQDQRRSRGAAAIVGEFRDHLEALREREVDRRRSEFADLSDEQFERVLSLTKSLLAKVAHQPTVALKDVAGTDRGLRLNEALRQLFDL